MSEVLIIHITLKYITIKYFKIHLKDLRNKKIFFKLNEKLLFTHILKFTTLILFICLYRSEFHLHLLSKTLSFLIGQDFRQYIYLSKMCLPYNLKDIYYFFPML